MDRQSTHVEGRVSHYRAAAAHDAPNQTSYKGLQIHALAGLHDAAIARLARLLETGSAVFDLAAGSGAMSLRLVDTGYSVEAAEYVAENFRIPDIVPVHQWDLNRPFAANVAPRKFDGVIALEIIEHLENPRAFLRECNELLKPGGILVLSTPNPNSIASKALFLREGNFTWFADSDYDQYGHITPLTIWQLTKCTAEAGFELLELTTVGDSSHHLRGRPALAILARLIALIDSTPAELSGDVSLWVLQKTIATS